MELFRRHSDVIDIVLLDMQMPEMTGVEVFHEMRRIRADVRAVLSSGFAEEDVVVRFGTKELAGFVHKPYRMADLMEAVRGAIEK